MDLYIDLIEYGQEGEVTEGDDVDADDTTLGDTTLGDSSRISLSSYGASYAVNSMENTTDSIALHSQKMGSIDDHSMADSIDSISTISTNLPSATKKHIRRQVKEYAKETECVYMTPHYEPPKKYLISRLWARFVSGPFHDWKKQQAMERRHPVLRYYEERVVRFEATRLANIKTEMENHAR